MNNNIAKLFIVPLNESFNSELYDALSLSVATNKKAKLDSYKSDIDKKLGLYADILVRISIYQDLNIENGDIEFGTNSYGKPFLMNNQGLSFQYIAYTQYDRSSCFK